MIHGESYKPIVAEAAKKSADKIYKKFKGKKKIIGICLGFL